MPSLPAAAALTRLLARADRVADLLPRLHDHLVEVTGGRSSVLLQPEPRTGVLLATSGSHLDDLPRDGWLASPAEQRAVAQAHAGAAPVVIRQAAEVSPTLAARLGAPHALIVPLGDAQRSAGHRARRARLRHAARPAVGRHAGRRRRPGARARAGPPAPRSGPPARDARSARRLLSGRELGGGAARRPRRRVPRGVAAVLGRTRDHLAARSRRP